MLSDAHCHYDEAGALAAIHRATHVLALVNCGDPAEWARNAAAIGPDQRLSFGVHPWQSATLDPATLTKYYQAAPVIGEIGLDTVWTKVPLAQQLPVFEAQLAIAARLHKPVVLHTKGCEQEILTLLKRYPNQYFVHWYSTIAYQADYLALGCYMSIGPDVVSDSAVRALARTVPANRLLLESDGVASLSWAWGHEVAPRDYAAGLHRCAALVAALRGTSQGWLQALAAHNLATFLQ